MIGWMLSVARRPADQFREGSRSIDRMMAWSEGGHPKPKAKRTPSRVLLLGRRRRCSAFARAFFVRVEPPPPRPARARQKPIDDDDFLFFPP
jgi:hypothetical protein